MTSSRFHRLRFALLIIGGAFSTMHCGCAGGSAAESETRPRKFYYVHAANGVPTSRAFVSGADNVQHLLGQNVPFGSITNRLTLNRDNSAMRATAEGGSGAFNADTGSTGIYVGNVNIVAATQLAGNRDKINMAYVDPSPTHVQLAYVTDWDTDVDVYVTAPNASIAGVNPDRTGDFSGNVGTTPEETLHPNTAYQFRLCASGTKNVVFDSGTLSGGAAGTIHMIMAVRDGGSKLVRRFIVDPR